MSYARYQTPVNKRERYYAKFGGPEKVQQMEQAMIARGKPYGIDFSYDGNLRQTTSSHRLLALAYGLGGEPMQRDLLEKLFKG